MMHEPWRHDHAGGILLFRMAEWHSSKPIGYNSAMKLQFSLATLYEWATVITGLLAVWCIAYGGLSIVTTAVDFKLSFGLIDVNLARGAIRLNTGHEWGLSVIETDENSLPWSRNPWAPPPVINRVLLPGFQYRDITICSLNKVWSLWISLLIPIILFSGISSICFWRYLRIRRLKSRRENGPNVG
jgi:hypothetical protein